MYITPEHSAKLSEIGIFARDGARIAGDGVLAVPCCLYPGASLGYVDVGAYSYVVGSADLQFCTMGNYTSIASKCTLLLGHPMDRITTSPVSYAGLFAPFSGHTQVRGYPRTYIGSDVWIGACVCIKAGVRIGHGAVVGAGAIVTKDIPNFAIAAGNPARVLRYRFVTDIQERILSCRWFDYDWQAIPLPWHNGEETLREMEAVIAHGHARRIQKVLVYEERGDDCVFRYVGWDDVPYVRRLSF